MKNINLIRKIAWSFHETTGLDPDDLFQEAALAYLEGLQNYNPEKGKATTFIWYCIISHLNNYLKKCEKQNDLICYFDDLGDISTYMPISTNGYFEGITEQLSKDAQIIVQEVLMNPCKYDSLTPAKAKWEIARRMLQSARHWSWKRIWKVMKDLELIFG